ncbi:uncharacterized protein LOC142340081 [Convolutriloba macropyga]|uniref:uncharacterized protein LOC142340081 n=1 Tax=Convolutriloba macropyga TaxID=536237 RepID=UPI003F52575A
MHCIDFTMAECEHGMINGKVLTHLKEDICASFLLIMGTPFVARFSGHRLVPEFDQVKALLRVEDKHLCSKLYHLDNHLTTLNYPVVRGFKQRGWRTVFQVEPMSQMRHSDLESQFLFQIVDVDVREKAGSNLLYCNITCLRVDKVQF